jgi:hypothetical protein
MNDYIKQLEEQNDELKQRLAVAEKPFTWVEVKDIYSPWANHIVTHEMRVKEYLFAYIAVRKEKCETLYMYTVCCHKDKITQKDTLEGAKQYAEDWFTSMFITDIT